MLKLAQELALIQISTIFTGCSRDGLGNGADAYFALPLDAQSPHLDGAKPCSSQTVRLEPQWLDTA